MPYCEFPRDFMLFDITPVENIFLMEHMPHAPGDFVRVYLYGLMLCRYPSEDASAESVARALGIKPEDVADAFRYWERAGLVVRLSDNPPRYQYISAQRAMLSEDDPQNSAYQYRDFFQQLQYHLGADRLVAPQEQSKAVDWIETLRLPEEVVLLLVEKQVERAKKAGKSLRYIFRDMDAIALRWASEDIRDLERAQEWLERDGAAAQAAKVVLKQMGLRRVPTLDEIRMAEKWVGELGLSKEDIVSACKELTKTANPSFAYLNTVLLRRSRGDGIEHFEQIKKVLLALGAPGMPTEAQSAVYNSLLGRGFDHEAIVYAAGQCSQKGKKTFEDLERRLEAWQREGITTREAAEEYARRREPGEKLMAQIYEILGLSARVTRTDVTAAVNWISAFPQEVILFAAERSKGMLKPVGYMTKILREWQFKGVRTLEQARAEAASFEKGAGAGAAARPGKTNPAQQYEQRKYDDEQLKQRVAVDFSELSGDEGSAT
ncbi:MAG: DnaD domain protein [Eubacteriales bacterium]|nr:DnaD domain protein [Eubacteriales bacterium]